MKCTQCGNKNLIKSYFGIQIRGDAFLDKDKFETYLCLECGHYELFAPKLVEEYKTAEAKKQAAKFRLEILNRELQELKASITPLDKEISRIEKELQNDDITVRKQKELKEKLHDLQSKKRSLPCQIQRHESEIKRHEDEIKRLR